MSNLTGVWGEKLKNSKIYLLTYTDCENGGPQKFIPIFAENDNKLGEYLKSHVKDLFDHYMYLMVNGSETPDKGSQTELVKQLRADLANICFTKGFIPNINDMTYLYQVQEEAYDSDEGEYRYENVDKKEIIIQSIEQTINNFTDCQLVDMFHAFDGSHDSTLYHVYTTMDISTVKFNEVLNLESLCQ